MTKPLSSRPATRSIGSAAKRGASPCDFPDPAHPNRLNSLGLVEACAALYPGRLVGRSDGALSPEEVVQGSPIGLLHLALLDLVDTALPDLSPWFDVCAPGATVVVTTTSARTSGAFDQAVQIVAGRFPSLRVPTGGATETLVAQIPDAGATPTVELLRNAPAAVEHQRARFDGETEEVDDLAGQPPTALGRDVVPPPQREVIPALQQLPDVERAALLSAIQAYRDLAAGVTSELAGARRNLAAHVEASRIEREHLVEEFLDRLDVLSAKISTSASRFAAEIEDKDRALGEQEQKVLAYASQAATAQSIIDDIRRSSSWRMTAPFRFLSRISARRHPRRGG